MQQSTVSRWAVIRPKFTLRWEVLLWGACFAIAVYVVLSPLAMLIFSSLRATKDRLPLEATEFTLANYSQVFASGATYGLLFNSFWYAAGATILCTVLSISLAWLLERTNVPWRSMLMVLILAPMGVPGIVSAMSWTLMANPNNGLLNVMLRGLLDISPPGPLDIYSIPGMIVVTALQFVPGLYLLLSAGFSRLYPSLEEASSLSGAKRGTTFRRITLPLLMPSILASFIFYFVFFMEVFEIPAVLGMPNRIFVLSTAVFEAMHPRFGLPNYGLASGYAILTIILAGVLIYLYGRVVRHQDRFAVVTGKAYRPRLIDLGGWKPVCVGAVLMYFTLAVGLPFFILVWTSLLPSYLTPSLEALTRISVASYLEVIHTSALLHSVQNTAVVAVLTSTVTLTIATVIAWLGVRRPFRGSGFADRFTFTIFGMPGIVIALGLIFIYIALPLPIYGTIVILSIAMVTRFLPYITRLMGPAFLHIHRELEDASSINGANWSRTMANITLPLVRPALARGWLWVFVHAMVETGMAVMLLVVDNETVPVTLWIAWFERANRGYSSALAVLLMLASGIFTYFIVRWTIPREPTAKRRDRSIRKFQQPPEGT